MVPERFDPDRWAENTGAAIKERIDGNILWVLLWEQAGMKTDPDLEAFFVAVALIHRTHPQPLFGVERSNLAREITAFMSSHPGQPEVLLKVRRNYRELGGRLLDTDPEWFYTKLADAYLDWLYSQEESKQLLPQALEKIERERSDMNSVYKRHEPNQRNKQWKSIFGE